ncbi:MAG: Phosphoserine phosphatase [Bacteroidetes bacterium ADurb.Bin217]|nr:MAG: Phosphoserine phosphatase [Bacteroidetes bacterium ADurb.Bin217]
MNEQSQEVILLSISGKDRPGVTASLTAILAQYGADILDIGQAVIHDTLSLGILFRLPETKVSGPVLKELLFKAYEFDIKARFTPINDVTYEEWVQQQGKNRYIVTLFGRHIEARHISEITQILFRQTLNIDNITRLSGRVSFKKESVLKNRACVELSVRGTPVNEQEMKREFLEISKHIGLDIAFQEDNAFRRNRRLICFDMDSTLIQTEVIVELAKYAGVEHEVSEITESAMRGEIDFCESFKKRIALLKGIDEKVLDEIARNLPITEGADRLIKTLKRFGYKVAILSGGFTFFGRYLQTKLGVDYVFANELEIKQGKLTGNYVGDIVDGAMKAELLKKLAFKEDIHLEQVIAVGDGANDLPMINIAGLGIAFHAKPTVQEKADNKISTIGLDGILYMLGFRDREVD